jgi:hypothetical protein
MTCFARSDDCHQGCVRSSLSPSSVFTGGAISCGLVEMSSEHRADENREDATALAFSLEKIPVPDSFSRLLKLITRETLSNVGLDSRNNRFSVDIVFTVYHFPLGTQLAGESGVLYVNVVNLNGRAECIRYRMEGRTIGSRRKCADATYHRTNNAEERRQ